MPSPTSNCSSAETERLERQTPANSGPIRQPPGNLRNRETAWWAREDSNLQPDRYERSALTIELRALDVLLSTDAGGANVDPSGDAPKET